MIAVQSNRERRPLKSYGCPLTLRVLGCLEDGLNLPLEDFHFIDGTLADAVVARSNPDSD